jgi:hypothetical protein
MPTIFPPQDMAPPGPAKPLQLCLKSSGQKLAVTRGAALFYSDTLNHLPPIFPFVLKSMPAVHEIMIFLTIREVRFRESYFLSISTEYACLLLSGVLSLFCCPCSFCGRPLLKDAEGQALKLFSSMLAVHEVFVTIIALTFSRTYALDQSSVKIMEV